MRVFLYLSGCFLLIAATAAAEFLLLRKWYPDRKEKLKIWIPVCAVLLSAGVFGYGFYLKDNTLLRAFTNAEFTLWLAFLSYTDIREKIIHNRMILAGLAFWVLLMILEIAVGGTSWKQLLLYSAAGFLIGFILMIVALIAGNSIGMGDVKMFMVLGLVYGLTDIYSILLISLVLMAATAVVLLLLKKANRKTRIPMAPFVAAGFLINVILGL